MSSSVGEATAIVLTLEERAALEGLARSRRTEHRTRLKARIVRTARRRGRLARNSALRTWHAASGCWNRQPIPLRSLLQRTATPFVLDSFQRPGYWPAM